MAERKKDNTNNKKMTKNSGRTNRKKSQKNKERFSGILVHPTSFPSAYGVGDLGDSAYEFVDYLVSAGQKMWQVLPLGPTGYGDSPYQAFSAFAGQPILISPDKMREEGLLCDEDLEGYPRLPEHCVDYGAVIWEKNKLFKIAYENFKKMGDFERIKELYGRFCEENADWLDDYTLFMALKDANGGKMWLQWGPGMVKPTAAGKKKLMEKYKEQMGYYKMLQFLFFDQWYSLKKYANDKGIKIIGDIPIFVSMDSADVWANKKLFMLASDGYPTHVAGVPPDYFSETGQLWGNPLYNWKNHQKEEYKWWIDRIKSQLKQVDYVRIDHFRGFESCWAVEYGAENAIKGKWLKGPGEKLFLAIEKALGDQLPIWAEDLGIITEEVEELRDQFDFPGMKILQFAFDDVEDNAMMPEHHIENCICYTGTHDNDTTAGWFRHASEESREKVNEYMHTGAATAPWAFIKMAMESKAKYVIIPLQDVMSLDSDARMNTPGRAAGNWGWRFKKQELDSFWAEYLKKITKANAR